MSLTLDLARASAGLNVVLLATLVAVWARTYGEIRSRETLGSLVFALLLLAENVLALYYYFSGLALPPAAVEAMLALQALETAAIAFLVYVTVQ
ncbi:hypothetical protein GRX01_02480 [Halobaculum sp. WSA2]|uniref:Uncharacterized protein n=1 Tax=Halobaculum saliterrae TaxID=2073113 RepID=A0A6B0SRN5_9EURY|nr:hypothetical protein [Halobaculum saliterrae]MXR40226.1 hypothetical protein [Halobaculum saliterrae]